MGNYTSTSSSSNAVLEVNSTVSFPHPLPSSIQINPRHNRNEKTKTTDNDDPYSLWKRLKTMKFAVSELCSVADMLYLCTKKASSFKFCSYDETLSVNIVRFGRICALVPCGQKVFAFAEYQRDCIIIDTNQLSYRYLEYSTSNEFHQSSDMHHFSACLVGRKIFVIGGKGVFINKRHSKENGVEIEKQKELRVEEGVCGVMVLDIGTLQFSNVPTLGDYPPPLYCHFLAVIANKIFVFGGINLAQIRHSLYIFDTVTSQWSIPRSNGNPPIPSFVKGIIACGVRLFAFCSGDNPCIYVLDVVSMNWGKIDLFGDVLLDDTSRVSMCLWGKRIVLFEGIEKNRATVLSEALDKGVLYSLELDKLHFSTFFSSPPTQNLSVDMRKAINLKLFSDVKFEVSNQNQVFYLHKCILQARGVSDIFCKDCVIEDEFSYEVVKFAIEVIYGDNVQLPTELYEEFRKFVNKYQLNRIQKISPNVEQIDSECETITSALEGDLSRMFQEKKNCDIFFRVEGKVIEAHRVVLWCRSKYFQVMLESEMKEAELFSNIEVQDVHYADLECVIYWMYTGVIDLEKPLQKDGVSPDPFGVLEIANRYQIEDLVNQSTDFLCKNLDVENVVQLLEWSDALNLTLLKSACIDFIVLNYAALLRVKEFHLLRTDLRDEILRYCPL